MGDAAAESTVHYRVEAEMMGWGAEEEGSRKAGMEGSGRGNRRVVGREREGGIHLAEGRAKQQSLRSDEYAIKAYKSHSQLSAIEDDNDCHQPTPRRLCLLAAAWPGFSAAVPNQRCFLSFLSACLPACLPILSPTLKRRTLYTSRKDHMSLAHSRCWAAFMAEEDECVVLPRFAVQTPRKVSMIICCMPHRREKCQP